MFDKHGICDWCGRLAKVAQHKYIDGLSHQSCESCYDLAKIDVKQFNIGELEARARLERKS
ncbi:hypothetical protein [Vibrio maerlii]|uniref:hypothetical protein n=1 Tax=Vibrio maerlii TaxID=2231648 RepID=UPI000E3BE740|nr:hypothetical protein [Vibrio maerlii]